MFFGAIIKSFNLDERETHLRVTGETSGYVAFRGSSAPAAPRFHGSDINLCRRCRREESRTASKALNHSYPY